MAALVTATDILLALPIAFYMARIASPRKRSLLFILVLLPLSALARGGADAAVWIVDPKTSQVKLRKVAIGQFREDGVTITSGLAGGDIVVTAGVHKLRADQVVRLADAKGASIAPETQAQN